MNLGVLLDELLPLMSDSPRHELLSSVWPARHNDRV